MITLRLSILTLVLLPLLSSCMEQDGVSRDSAGRSVNYAEWKPIERKDIAIDLAKLESVSVTKFEERLRDNAVVNQRIGFHGGGMYIQRVLDGFFGLHSMEGVLNEDMFRGRVESTFVKNLARGRSVKLESIEHISDNVVVCGGYLATLSATNSGEKCFYANSGYRLGTTSYDNDMGEYDTFVEFWCCGSDLSPKQIVRFLGTLSPASTRPQ